MIVKGKYIWYNVGNYRSFRGMGISAFSPNEDHDCFSLPYNKDLNYITKLAPNQLSQWSD